MHYLRVATLWLAIMSTACGGPGSTTDAASIDGSVADTGRALGDAGMQPSCDVPMELEACEGGYLYADCGGEGVPTFGCDDRRCLWFATSCVATGFHASDCSSSEICCHDVAGGTWPFVGWIPEEPIRASDIAEQIRAFGRQTITSSAPGTIVTIDPAFAAPPEPAVTCEGDAALQICTPPPIFGVGFARHGGSALAIVRNSATSTEALLLEAVDRAGGAPLLRAFVREIADAARPGGVSCERGVTPLVSPIVDEAVFDHADVESPDLHGRVTITIDTSRVTLVF